MHDKWVRVFHVINDFNNTIRAISTSGIGIMQIHFILTKVQLLICFHEDSYNHSWYERKETFHTCLLLLISMLWPRQAIFESKGDKLSSSAECRIRNWKSLDTHSPAARLNTHSQTDWGFEDQAKNLNSTARPYDEWAFSALDFTATWLSHLALAMDFAVWYKQFAVKINALKKHVPVLIWKFIFLLISLFSNLVTYILILEAISI